MKTIVTGASGLLGRHVAEALVAAGHDVLGVDAVAPGRVAWRHATADLTDLGSTLQLVRDCDAVVHVAAIPRPTGRAGGEVFKTNLATAYNVVEAAVMAGARRFVYASSFSVFGYPFFEKPVRPPYLPVDLNHPVGAQDPYGLSKWLGEEIVDAVVRRGAFSAVSIRMPWIQTPGSFSTASVRAAPPPTAPATCGPISTRAMPGRASCGRLNGKAKAICASS